jgi:guanylate kinase
MSSSAAARRGSLFVIAAPSGAGKTSLLKAVRERDPSLCLSISHTTRKQRPTEVPGRDYHFVPVEEFNRMRDGKEFLEYAQVFDNFYGTGREQVRAMLDAGKDVILEIDWQGARQVRAAQPDCISIFILPPSKRELEKRLRDRNTDSDEVIARRLRDSMADMSHYSEFDRVIVNREFDQAVDQLLEIMRGNPGFRSDRPDLKPLLADLLG